MRKSISIPGASDVQNTDMMKFQNLVLPSSDYCSHLVLTALAAFVTEIKCGSKMNAPIEDANGRRLQLQQTLTLRLLIRSIGSERSKWLQLNQNSDTLSTYQVGFVGKQLRRSIAS